MSAVLLSFFVPVILIFGGIIFLIVWIIRSSSNPKNTPQPTWENERTPEPQLPPQEFDPQKGYSARHISRMMQFKYIGGFTKKLTGKIHAIDGTPIIAFQRVESGMGANGSMIAKSSDFQINFTMQDECYTILFNQSKLGVIQATGDIFDASGNKIGHAKHPQKVSFSLGKRHFRSGDNTFPLLLNNRKLATIHVSSDRSEMRSFSSVFKSNELMQPILMLHDTASEEEEKWLLALAILEVAYHGHWML